MFPDPLTAAATFNACWTLMFKARALADLPENREDRHVLQVDLADHSD